MTILVCPLSRVTEQFAAWRPDRVVSLLDPGSEFPDLDDCKTPHLRLEFHDLHTAGPGDVLPAAHHVAAVLEFVSGWDRVRPVLVHCRAGRGRSPATAFIIACALNREVDERGIARELRRASPFAIPNRTLCELADEELGRSGRLLNAITEIAPGIAPDNGESIPFAIPSSYPRSRDVGARSLP